MNVENTQWNLADASPEEVADAWAHWCETRRQAAGQAATRADPVRHGLELGGRLYDANAILRAVIHQLHAIEDGRAGDTGLEAEAAGRAVRMASDAINKVADLVSCCRLYGDGDVQDELEALHPHPNGDPQ